MPLDPSDQGPGFAERTKQLQAGPSTQGPQLALSPEVQEDLRERRRRQLRTMVQGGGFAGPQAAQSFGGY